MRIKKLKSLKIKLFAIFFIKPSKISKINAINATQGNIKRSQKITELSLKKSEEESNFSWN
jgi:hypothetical protein